MTVTSLLDIRLADGTVPPTGAPGYVMACFSLIGASSAQKGERALRSALTKYLSQAASEEQLHTALEPLLERGFLERHAAYEPEHMAAPMPGMRPTRIPKLDEPNDGEPYYTPTVRGVKAALVCAAIVHRWPPQPWLLGGDRLADQVIFVAKDGAAQMAKFEVFCACAPAEDVHAAVRRAVHEGYLEERGAGNDKHFRLTIDGEARLQKLVVEVKEATQHFLAPAESKQPVPIDLLLRPDRKLDLLRSLSEATLSTHVIVPLLEGMGFRDVRYNNGPNERGKDVVGWKPDELGEHMWLAVAAKAKDLTGAAQGNDSIFTAKTQIEQALSDSLTSAPSGRAVKMERCWVITSGRIPSDALSRVQGPLEASGMNRVVRWIDGHRLVLLVDQHAQDVWASLERPAEEHDVSWPGVDLQK